MSDANLLDESRAIWDANADAWDARMNSGGGFQSVLIAPTVERMLNIQPGESVLDIACGNGIFSRRLAELGASVAASDFSPKLVELAKQRTTEHADRIAYHVADATDEAQLLALGANRQPFDAAVCLNAIMDMPAIEPLFRAERNCSSRRGASSFRSCTRASTGWQWQCTPNCPTMPPSQPTLSKSRATFPAK